MGTPTLIHFKPPVTPPAAGKPPGLPARRGASVRRGVSYALLLALLLPAIAATASYPRYRAAMQLGRERLTGSQVGVTALGDVEYAVGGSGPSVLLVHGAGGGYDQGLLLGETFVGDGYHFVAPSRFGYLRSPILQDGSPAAQADTYAALLDNLGLQRVAVVAFSDGGPSALQFALRHPERTAALVMISAKSRSAPPDSPLQSVVFNSIFRSDYLYWALSEASRPFLLGMLGVPSDVQTGTTALGASLASQAVDGMHPISLRRDGIYHDRDTLAVLPDDVFRLEDITAPTLVVHAVDDGLQPFIHGQNTAGHVPGARLVSYEQGGHLLSLQIDDAREQVAAFLAQHAAQRP